MSMLMLAFKKPWLLPLLLLFSQDSARWEIQSSAALENIQLISINNRNELYCSTSVGDIHKFDESLNLSNTIFSPEFPTTPTLINTDNYVNAMVFYQEIQEVVFLDRFLQARNKLDLNLQINVFASAVAPASDGMLWVFNLSNQRLMKFNPPIQEPLVDIMLLETNENISLEITYLKEYQNLLFAYGKQGKLFVIDLLGNIRKELAIGEVQSIHLYNDRCAFIADAGNRLSFFNIYDNTFRLTSLPLPEPAKDAIMRGDFLFLISKNGRLKKYKQMIQNKKK